MNVMRIEGIDCMHLVQIDVSPNPVRKLLAHLYVPNDDKYVTIWEWSGGVYADHSTLVLDKYAFIWREALVGDTVPVPSILWSKKQ